MSAHGQWTAFFVYWLVAMVPFCIWHFRLTTKKKAAGVTGREPIFNFVFGVLLAPIALLVAVAFAWEVLMFGVRVLAGR